MNKQHKEEGQRKAEEAMRQVWREDTRRRNEEARRALAEKRERNAPLTAEYIEELLAEGRADPNNHITKALARKPERHYAIVKEDNPFAPTGAKIYLGTW